MTVAGVTVTVNQPANCSYTVSPTTASVAATATSGSFTVTTGSSCTWSATSSAAWLTTSNGSSRTGSGTVNYSAAANSGAARSATFTIGGTTMTVNQAGGNAPGIPTAPSNLRVVTGQN
jgi:hypothetical protein